MQPIWHKEITYLKKVGPKRAEVLAKEAGIRTYLDLLHYYPRKYVDRSQKKEISDIREDGEHVALVGKIIRIEVVKTKRGRGRLSATFTDGSGFLELTWFQGVKWLQASLKKGEEIALFGRVSRFGGTFQISHPEIDKINQENGQKNVLQIVPFYPSTEKLGRMGLDSRGFRTITHLMLAEAGGMIGENLSQSIQQANTLISHKAALQYLHYPASFTKLKQAQYRIKFEEFFFFQLLLARRRLKARHQNQAPSFTKIGEYFNAFFEEHMPFSLTGAQKRVLKEIRRDLAMPSQMNRLVQGDVGSGKTMVAFMSMLIARGNGYQAAMMAPTAILAEQHFKKISAMAAKVGLRTTILVGGQRKKERRLILEGIENGEFDFVVGTHALIEKTVVFQKLGLVVVDEQHKFGVEQRAKLWQKGSPFPHNLVMTATPIPRTLAMTVYGDVDVSIIDELPPGRKPIETRVHGESKRLEVLGFIKRQLDEGRQAYVVYPLVEESEKLDLIAVVKGHELLERYFTDYRVGIVHGKMKADNKEMEMQRFVRNETQVLVSTTVIEVGVDVPNSSIMVIENAERFGLSQLHQLRGRVGRGQNKSYCILMSGKKVSTDGRKRLKAMRETQDGFKISEIDLELRGPGDFLGTRQSGLPEFHLANIIDDRHILEAAREAAFSLAQIDPDWVSPENAPIRQYLMRYQKAVNLLS
ncbi:MAG: ATP-dependent DNA helicase RecG [Bacteroidia bacterium]